MASLRSTSADDVAPTTTPNGLLEEHMSMKNRAAESRVDRTQELLHLLSTTLTSLASDASALRDLTHVDAACGRVSENDHENGHPNHIVKSLCELDGFVSALEGKARTLSTIVSEERRSLDDLAAMHAAAEAQGRVLDRMLEACRDDPVQETEALVSERRTHSLDHPQPVSSLSARKPPRPSTLEQYGHPSLTATPAQPLVSPSKRKPSRMRRDSFDPRGQSVRRQSHRFRPVCEDELMAVSKAIRGRVTLAVVNDALLDIEKACLRKQKNMAASSQTRNSTTQLSAEPWTVTEQDLRQSCAFFRSGESTARAILLLLRTLKRLQQIPGGHSEVYYILSE